MATVFSKTFSWLCSRIFGDPLHPVDDTAEEEDGLQTENPHLTMDAAMTSGIREFSLQGDEKDEWQGATDIPDEQSTQTDEGNNHSDKQNEDNDHDSDEEEVYWQDANDILDEKSAQDCDGNDQNDESNERNGQQDSEEEEDGQKDTNGLSDKQNLKADDGGSIEVEMAISCTDTEGAHEMVTTVNYFNGHKLPQSMVLVYPQPLAQEDDGVNEVLPVDCTEAEVSKEIVIVANGRMRKLNRQVFAECARVSTQLWEPVLNQQDVVNHDVHDDTDDSDPSSDNQTEGNSEEQLLEKLVLEGQLLETKDPSNSEASGKIPPNDDGIIDEPRQKIEGINSAEVMTVTPPVVNYNPRALVATSTETEGACLVLPSPRGLQNGRQSLPDSKKRSRKNKARIKNKSRKECSTTHCVQCSDVNTPPPNITIPK